ncbi:MAG: selenium-dependent molybdenum cofactor biosynthesis protein YqeB [Phascolarctobacterium sp.]|nr:selenium-dependent molybdenum cofactor biosynthesis protein YqeB [Phascolarctobacterium sp.]
MLVVIRGAGDLASGIALRLVRSGIKVVMTDLEKPLAIRRSVAFCEANRLGEITIEDKTAKHANDSAEALNFLSEGFIPVLADPEAKCIDEIKPLVVVDAILAKRNLGTKITDAPIVIGVGPGFSAGKDCHAVVETMRGHTLGRVIYDGPALPNTNIPGLIGGFAGERVLRAPATGVFKTALEIGAIVKQGDVTGYVEDKPMLATLDGALRGLIADGTFVKEGLKCGDVDPRGDASYCKLASDKSLAIGGGVLEAILHFSKALEEV